MKLKDYLNSLVSRRKSNVPSKSAKPKPPHGAISSADCHYEVCEYEDSNKHPPDDHHSRTQILLARHAQLVDTIVGIRSPDNPCPHCPTEQQNSLSNRNYSNTLATCNPYRECQHPTTHLSSSNNSLWTKTRQRSKIRTNPWIKTTRTSQPEYSIYEPTLPSTLIHSESFPQTISNGNLNPANIVLHQSDSGHGFSLSSSRIIDSSSPDNTSSDGPVLDENHLVQYHPPKTMPSDNKRRAKKSIQSKKSSVNHKHRLYNDDFSLEFEEIVENERLHKQRSPRRKSPFILPLDETDVKLTPPSSILYPTTLKKTNSRTILKHIEEIENEIRIIKNLNLDHDEQILSSKDGDRQSIHEQVDQWVEECLTSEYNHFSNTQKDYSIYSNNNHQTSFVSKPKNKTELMTAFYLSSIPTTKRTYSFIDQPIPLSSSQIITKDFKPIHECPF